MYSFHSSVSLLLQCQSRKSDTSLEATHQLVTTLARLGHKKMTITLALDQDMLLEITMMSVRAQTSGRSVAAPTSGRSVAAPTILAEAALTAVEAEPVIELLYLVFTFVVKSYKGHNSVNSGRDIPPRLAGIWVLILHT